MEVIIDIWESSFSRVVEARFQEINDSDEILVKEKAVQEELWDGNW